MTFKQLQDAVLSDRFAEAKRDDAKRWINYRYARIWAQEAWTFKTISVDANFALADDSVSLSALGLQRIIGVWDSSTNGNSNRPIYADRPEDFHDWSTTSGGRTYGFTVIGDNLILDRPVSTSTDMIVIGEAKFEPLVEDTDVPLLPEGWHDLLTYGAISDGLRNENDPTWQGFEQDYIAGLEDLRKGYLTAVRNYTDAYPSWP